jgi:hypothetical protein
MEKPTLKKDMRNYEFLKTEILTPDEYVDACEG